MKSASVNVKCSSSSRSALSFGACGLAPVVVIDEKVHGLMTPEKTLELIENIRKEETTNV